MQQLLRSKASGIGMNLNKLKISVHTKICLQMFITAVFTNVKIWKQTRGHSTGEIKNKLWCTCAKLLQSCLTLCDPMDCSPPGSSVHGILQARTLEWVAMPSFRGSSRPRNGSLSLLHWQAGSLPLASLGKPQIMVHPYNGILSVILKKKLSSYEET